MSDIKKKISETEFLKHINASKRKVQFTVECTMTPLVAKLILEKYNSANRNISPVHVESMARDMANNGWKGHVGDEITFDWNGILSNGQHRLAAMVKSNTFQQAVVRFGLDPESKLAEGRGRQKQYADILSMIHKDLPNRNEQAALVRMLCSFFKNQHNPQNISGNFKPTNSELHEVYNKHGADLYESYKFVNENGINRVTVDTNGAFVHFLLKNSKYGKAKADEFILAVANGANLGPDDPRLIVRNRLMDNKGVRKITKGQRVTVSWRHQSAKDIVMGLMIKGWNDWLQGKTWTTKQRNPVEMVRIDGLDAIGDNELYQDLINS